MTAKEETTMAKTEYVIEPGRQELMLTRVFDAPRELLFKCFTDPELVSQWLGPRDLVMTLNEMDIRPGGTWRYIHRDPHGNEHGFHGVYHDVVAPERIVQTFEYEGEPGHVLLQTAAFESRGERTRLVMHSVYQSVADRDGMVAAGMKRGSDDSMERLADLLEELKAGKG
jgi:uncharacterized protein YndB with AHSA1/START domain